MLKELALITTIFRFPLVEVYFTRLAPAPDSDPLVYSVANNGWIWDADPLQNFALPPSKAYLRREVIVWSDCVKLRYGSGPSDNPWLWEYMTAYVCSLAKMFEGFRIDNCHSTPLHVGKHMLDAGRVVRPDLYICAELFTGNEDMDLVFVRELGINSLIRECGNAWDPKEFSRLLYRYGLGKPMGSMDGACMVSKEEIASPTGKGPIRTAIVTPLNGSFPHALLYDLTHDNETPLDKRSAEDALPTGALASFSLCAVGSVKGFDDLYPKLLNLVHEKRRYEVTGVGPNSGIARVKRILNELHLEMVLGGYEEGHVHQENDVIHPSFAIQASAYSHSSTSSFPGFSRRHRKGICSLRTLHFTRGLRIAVSVSYPIASSCAYLKDGSWSQLSPSGYAGPRPDLFLEPVSVSARTRIPMTPS